MLNLLHRNYINYIFICQAILLLFDWHLMTALQILYHINLFFAIFCNYFVIYSPYVLFYYLEIFLLKLLWRAIISAPEIEYPDPAFFSILWLRYRTGRLLFSGVQLSVSFFNHFHLDLFVFFRKSFVFYKTAALKNFK